jgi:hypothetical protein
VQGPRVKKKDELPTSNVQRSTFNEMQRNKVQGSMNKMNVNVEWPMKTGDNP